MKIIKILTLILLVSFILAPSILAEKTAVSVSAYKNIRTSNPSTVRRVPVNLPIQVIYDDETRIIEVCGYESLTGEVYLLNEFGQTIDYSPDLNCYFTVPSINESWVTVNMTGEDWDATCSIPL